MNNFKFQKIESTEVPTPWWSWLMAALASPATAAAIAIITATLRG